MMVSLPPGGMIVVPRRAEVAHLAVFDRGVRLVALRTRNWDAGGTWEVDFCRPHHRRLVAVWTPDIRSSDVMNFTGRRLRVRYTRRAS